jgi:hypothetical protein
MKNKIESIILDCINYTECKNYHSYDVFDALNSEFINRLLSKNIFLKRVAIQVNAKSLLNLRPLLGVKEIVHTKTLSDFLSIYTLMYKKTKNNEYKHKARQVFELLWLRKIEIEKGFGWGLNFPYTTRFTNADKDTPNLYNTINATHSILDYYETFESSGLEEIVDGVLRFILNYLGVVNEDDSTAWLRYYPNQTGMPTPNVNATSASLFVRINTIYTNKVDKLLIKKLLNFVKLSQNQNGSWYYTTNSKGQWIDGFHTGFILESLSLIKYLEPTYNVDLMLEKGTDFFVKNLISEDYIPKFFDESIYPIESQNCAQCIQTLSKLIIYNNFKYDNLLKNIIDVVLENLYSKKGFFYHKKTKLFTFKHYYARWSQSPMILSLIYSLNSQKK